LQKEFFMKNPRRLFGIIALAAVIGFTLAGCGDSGAGDPFSPPPNNVAAPTASPAAGRVAGGTAVTLSCATSGAAIYYTLDGNTPTASSAAYSAPIGITAAVTIKAIAVKEGMDDSDILIAAYTINGTAKKLTVGFMSNFMVDISDATGLRISQRQPTENRGARAVTDTNTEGKYYLGPNFLRPD
jgi:predicted small lipoprotein YifL